MTDARRRARRMRQQIEELNATKYALTERALGGSMAGRIHETKNAVTFYDDEETRLQIMHADWEHTQTIFVSVGRNSDDDVKDRVIEIDVHDFLKVVEVVRAKVEPDEAMRDALVEAHAAAEHMADMRDRLALLLLGKKPYGEDEPGDQ